MAPFFRTRFRAIIIGHSANTQASADRASTILAGFLLALAGCNTQALSEVSSGLYLDPDHNGHGFDLQRVGLDWVMVFYTYDDLGRPEWMLGVLTENKPGALTGTLDLYDYRSDRLLAQQVVRSVGSLTLDFNDPCDGGEETRASLSWELEGERGLWCVQTVLDKRSPPAADFAGLWFAGPEDAGWGISLDYESAGDTSVEVQVLFYYDADGWPRWALGSGPGGAEVEMSLQTFRGYCRTCEPITLEAFEAGTISHVLNVVDGRPRGRIDIDVAYALGEGGWQRDDSPLVQLSEPQPGLVPLPAQVEPDRAVVIFNTSVVPMTEPGLVLSNQTVVIESGEIRGVGDYGTVPFPEDSVFIDGRGLYVGPGLHDMHTHFAYGGVAPMYEAGTLFVANGVTTVLNMGDGGTQNLPGTDAVFASGARIGPRVYAGAAAYGPADNRAASLTVSTPAEARAYAENAQRDGYRFLKLYNALSPDVVRQFIVEGERLGMPVNGHLPKTLSMRASLEGGQTMIAHVAEIYFTLFSNRPNDALLPDAAALMLDNGTYLTDTLTASESFAANYGGNEASFREFSRREGVQYQPTTFAERGWRNFFESSTLQPPGSQPGQLDDRLVYFKKMVRYFSDAGVPIILGTDSPGHIGVVSGFSVHENLRLYEEIGLDPYAAYAAASSNPGRYLAETLELEAGSGTVEVGRRADLLLLEADPLTAVGNLRRPLGVMTRGRFYSRATLQAALDALDAKYRDPFTTNSGRR